MKKHKRNYKDIQPDCYNGHPEIERKRIISKVVIDRKIFKHSKKEKELIKLAKSQAKMEEMKEDL
ncbi:MAG: hypothetical protein WC389_11555 [Lutibacter sp.]|jgi:hypothetical protein